MVIPNVSTYVRTSLAVGENYNLTFSHYEDYNKMVVELFPMPPTLWCRIDDLTNDTFSLREQSHSFGCGTATAQAVNGSSGPKWSIKVVLQDCNQVQLRCGNRLASGDFDLSGPLTLTVQESEELYNVCIVLSG